MATSVFKRAGHARALVLSSGALALAACSFGPNGDPPAMPQPAHYGAEPQITETVPAQGVTQQFVVGAKPVPTWWHLYQSDDLNALVDEGLRNSPTLAATDKSLTAAREQLRGQIGSSLLPTIDAVAQGARQRALAVPELGPNTFLYNTFVGQLQAHYTIDLFGASRLANAALASRVNVQIYQLESARRALAANIVTAAITAAALHAQIDTTERLVALANDDARDAARRYALGAISHADMLNAQQSAASLSASLPGLKQQWTTTRHALAVLIGRTPDAAPPDLDLAQLRVPEQVPVVVPSELLRARPDVQAADAALKAAAADVGDVPEPVADGFDGTRRLQLAGGALRCGSDLGGRGHAVTADLSWRRAARATARGVGDLRRHHRSVQANGARRLPERGRYARGARTRRAGARCRQRRRPCGAGHFG
jgi:NodT family efflux transporter outer membrane factor (OMF) lipoprotein